MSSGSDANGSLPLSDTDAQVLYLYGQATTQDAVGLIWETIFLSAYGVFFAVAVYSICRRGLKSHSSIAMLCVVVYLYATSLTLWALNVTWWFKTANSLLIDGPSIPLPDREDVANAKVAALATPMEALFMFNMVVGDSVVIWRARVLYQRMLWVVSIPCIMLVMSFIFTIIDITCLTGAGLSDQSSIAGGGPLCAHAELMSWAFSFVTNATCTILIGFKAWQHRKATRALNIVGDKRRMSADKILSILVESGFIYCLFWLTQLILFFDISRGTPLIYAYELFSGMGDQISGMYPTLIIVIVNFHQTIWEPASSLTTSGAAGSTMQWATGSKRTVPTETIHSQRGVSVRLDIESSAGMSMGDMSSKRSAFHEDL
ncbi:hypothetical protein DFH09DRAFT_1185427 [Mycena vulgaris]|nr:hypothetical protein DFH09DRAFT_1185427 [Mycena vulgaris]